MFDGRIYRAALLPLLLVVAIVGFSLGGAAAPLRSTLAPDAFDGSRAYATLGQLLSAFPDRRPGSSGDQRLAAYVAQSLRALSGSAGGGFRVSERNFTADTAEGPRTLTDVIAVRPGSSGERPLAILAHRDAVGRGSAAELSGTAALLELAHVFANSETRRTVVLVSTDGGSEGDAGAAYYASHLDSGLDATPDAAIVLGDLAGARAHKPFVLPFSGATATAPDTLQATLQGAISQEVGADPGSLDLVDQLVHLAFPLAVGEQSPLNGAQVPAVAVQVSGVRGPIAGTAVSEARLANFGRAVLAAVYALDEGPDVAPGPSTRLSLGDRSLPEWAIRLLALAALLAPLVACVDALARLRRRRQPLVPSLVWSLSAAVPFAAAALFAMLLGALGIVAAPGAQLSSAAIAVGSAAPVALATTALALVLGLLSWPALVRRLAVPVRPAADAAGLAPLLVLLAVALIVWLLDPFAALLLAPAAHLWLLAAEPRSRAFALSALLAGIVPPLLLLLAYAHELALGPLALAESVVLALAGGQVGLPLALLWSLALGCVPALLAHTLAATRQGVSHSPEPLEVSTRGPLTYAGPGSLGGTESALRR